MTSSGKVAIVDDDPSIRRSLSRLMRAEGYAEESFASAEEFVASRALDDAGCLVLDIKLPGMSGFDLQDLLAQRSAARSLRAEPARPPLPAVAGVPASSASRAVIDAQALSRAGVVPSAVAR